MYEMIRNLLKHFKNPKTDTWEEPPAPLPEDEEEVGAYTCEEPPPSAPPPQTREEKDPLVQEEEEEVEAYTFEEPLPSAPPPQTRDEMDPLVQEEEEEAEAYPFEEPLPASSPPQTRDEKDPRVQKEEAYTCMDCMEQRNENCFGKKKICPDFRYAPRITQQDRETWPKFGDATGFRLKAVKRRGK